MIPLTKEQKEEILKLRIEEKKSFFDIQLETGISLVQITSFLKSKGLNKRLVNPNKYLYGVYGRGEKLKSR